jgi:hypothetical protein
MLDRLTRVLAHAVQTVDARLPVAVNKRTGAAFGAGLGPHSETETFKLIIDEARAIRLAPRRRRHRRDHGSPCPDRRKLPVVDPLDEAAGQEVQGDPASSLDRKISPATNEGGTTYGTDQIDRARTCLARRDRLWHCQHRRHCRAPQVQRSSRQHDDIDGIHRAGSGQGRRRRAASARHRRRHLA